MSAESPATPSKVTGTTYFTLRLPKFHVPAIEPESPIAAISPSHVETPGTPIPPGSSTPKAKRPGLPTCGHSAPIRGTSSDERYEEPIQKRYQSGTTQPDTRKSSNEDKDSKTTKLHFKLPGSFYKPDTHRSESKGSVSKRSRKSESGFSKKSRRSRTDSSGIGTPPLRLSIEPLPPPVSRALTHSVGYSRKITIETDFEDSRPTPKPVEEPEPKKIPPKAAPSTVNPLTKWYASSKKCVNSLLSSKRTRTRRPSIYFRGAAVRAKKNGTNDLLQRTSSLLRQATGKESPASRSGTTGSSVKKGERTGRRLFSIAGLKRHRSISNSSSVRNAKMGKAPSVTPEETAMYVGSDQKPHMKLDISNSANKTTFLPSEAQRIRAPPTPGIDSEWTFHKRGFFFDYDKPPNSGAEDGDPGEQGKGKQPDTEDVFSPQQTRRGRRNSETAWYTMQMDMVEHDAEVEIRKTEIQEYDVPEHLPSSPLCPRNPKHRSKGKGTCMFHGSDRDKSRQESAKSVEGVKAEASDGKPSLDMAALVPVH